MPRGSTSQEQVNLVRLMRKSSKETKANLWRELAERLSKSKRKRIEVNLSRVSRYTKPNETVVVPGKVLGSGRLRHPVKIAAFNFSKQAAQKIIDAKGTCMTISELLKKNQKGSGVKIIG